MHKQTVDQIFARCPYIRCNFNTIKVPAVISGNYNVPELR